MRPHGRQTDRRGRGAREQEDDYYGSLHGEGHSREGYGHPRESYHRDDAYRASTATHRSSYDGNNESSAPRSHRDSWRTRDQEDIYGRHDGYQHQISREDHTYLERERELEHWPARPEMDTRYNHSHSDWYDQPYPSTSYAEPSSHHRNPIPHDNTPSTYASWAPEEPYTDDRLSIGTDDRHGERSSQARRGQYQPRKGNKHNKKFNTDSGWDRNKRRKGWEESSEPRTENSQELAERKWEPAPSWKASNPESEDRSQGGQRYHSDRWSNSKSNKRVNNNQKQRRDWRNEDDSLNNWTRRSNQAETSNRQTGSFNKVVKTPSRRKYQDSVSPSRSQSPTASYRSRRSSRDRSRTRSVSPHAKRRRKDYSPNDYPRSGTPSEKGYYSRQEIPPPRYDVEQSYSPRRSPNNPDQPSEWHRRSPVSFGGRSPEPRPPAWTPNDRISSTWTMEPNVHDRGRSPSPGHGTLAPPPPRRRSVSSLSSRSSARSRSRSPVERSKTVHRLPSTDPTVSTPLPPPKPEVTQTTGKKKKKKNKANGQNNNHQKNTNLAREVYPNPTMPPPSIIPSTHNTNALDSTGDSQMGYSPSIPNASNAFGHSHPPPDVSPVNQPSLPPRFTTVKSAGFKPIASTNSSIKRFFNVDDDDVAPVPHASHTPSFVPAHQPLQPEQVVIPVEQPPKIIYERPVPPPPTFTAPTAEPIGNTQPLLEVQNTLEFPPKSSSPSLQISAPQIEGESATEEQVQAEDGREDFYKIVSQVGEGTFGKVYKAENTTTKAFVALKRIRMESERDGFPVTAMREIKLLQSLRQTNIVQLYEMMISNGSIYMVFEYMDHDLTGILSQTQFNFEDAHLKSLCHQMLSGLAYLHQKGVIHRDIKGSNILINNKGELKLGDFGLARFYQKRRRSDYTNRVITLWYRPPELLLGATVYGPEVDMWSAGCIMLELYTKKPVFQGLDEIHQLDVIYKILGTPDPQRWAGIMELPWYELIKPKEVIPNNFRELFRKWMSPAALDLAEQLLAYDPALRATAVQAMGAPYFTQEEPPALPPSGLATLEGEWHELETKRERAKKRRKPEGAP